MIKWSNADTKVHSGHLQQKKKGATINIVIKRSLQYCVISNKAKKNKTKGKGKGKRKKMKTENETQ